MDILLHGQRTRDLRSRSFDRWSYCIGRALEQVFEAWIVDLLSLLDIRFVRLPIGEPYTSPTARPIDDGGVK
jgi:hypothetical protein